MLNRIDYESNSDVENLTGWIIHLLRNGLRVWKIYYSAGVELKVKVVNDNWTMLRK